MAQEPRFLTYCLFRTFPPIDRRAYRASWRNDAAVLVARSLPLSRLKLCDPLEHLHHGAVQKGHHRQ